MDTDNRSLPDDPNDALKDMLRWLHPDMDVDALLSGMTHGLTSHRLIPEMSVSQLARYMPQRSAELVHLIPGIARSMARDCYPASPNLGRFASAAVFLRGLYLGFNYEHCYILLLRKNQRLIREVLVQRGSVASVPFYVRNILEVTLDYGADAVVLSHNHPGRTAAPSQDDIQSTYSLMEALRPLAIPLLDHIVLAGDQAVSIRRLGAIPEEIWMSQSGECGRMLRDWFQPVR